MAEKATNRLAPDSFKAYDDFLASASVDRLQKIAARYELLRMVEDVPGDIVECGVYKGSGLYTLAKLSSFMTPQAARKIVGFDFFGENRAVSMREKKDKEVLDRHDTNWTPQKTILENLAAAGITNVELVAGDVVKTTARYAKENLGFRIALLYLDVDNYEGTLGILQNFYPLVTPGGIVVFDEYGLRNNGESDAVSEYFKGSEQELFSLPGIRTPTAYMVKEGF